MQKHVNLVDLVKSFPTNIYLQNLASIQKRTSTVKFAHLAEKSEKGSISNLSTKVPASFPDIEELSDRSYAWELPFLRARRAAPLAKTAGSGDGDGAQPDVAALVEQGDAAMAAEEFERAVALYGAAKQQRAKSMPTPPVPEPKAAAKAGAKPKAAPKEAAKAAAPAAAVRT